MANNTDHTVVCAYPADLSNMYAAGNWKDINGINRLLGDAGFTVREVQCVGSEGLRGILEAAEGATDLLVHYSFWPEVLESVRKARPNLRIHTRIHNAEALQHLHRVAPGLWPTWKNLRGWYGAVNTFFRDSRCRRGSNTLLCISEWDKDHYQKFLPGSASLVAVPYHSPWPALRPNVALQPWHLRRNAVVCLAGGRDRIGASQRDNLVIFSRALLGTAEAVDWRFELSSGARQTDGDDENLEPVESIGVLAQPWDLMCTVKAVALLTHLGYGCKTTVVDALAAGCHVIVDRRLLPRLGKDIAALCTPVDMTRPDSFKAAMAAIAIEPKPTVLNERLRARALDGLMFAMNNRKATAAVS